MSDTNKRWIGLQKRLASQSESETTDRGGFVEDPVWSAYSPARVALFDSRRHRLSKPSFRGFEIQDQDTLILCCPLLSVKDLRFVLDFALLRGRVSALNLPSFATKSQDGNRERINSATIFVLIL